MTTNQGGEASRELAALKELVFARLDAMDKALTLAFSESSRRLDILNHAHEKAVEVQHTYVPREVFEAFLQRFEEYKVTTSRALILREGAGQGADKLIAYTFGGIGALVGIIGIIIVIGDVLTA